MSPSVGQGFTNPGFYYYSFYFRMRKDANYYGDL